MKEDLKGKESGIMGKITENAIGRETGSVIEDTSRQEGKMKDRRDIKMTVIIMIEKDEVAERVMTAKAIIGDHRVIVPSRSLAEMMMQKVGIEEVVHVMKEAEIEEIKVGTEVTHLQGKIKTRYIV